MVNSLLFNILGKIFLMVALGFFLRKINVINEDIHKGLSNLLLKAVLPISILSSSSNAFSKELSQGLLIITIACLLYYISTIIITTFISKLFKTDIKTKKIFITMSVFANVGFIGFPISSELIGSEGMLYAVIYNMFYQIFFFTYGTNLLENRGALRLSSIFKSPVTLSSFVAIAVYLSPFRFPGFISETLSTVGGMMVPISMMVIGSSLVGMNPKEILKDKYSYLVSFLRLAVFPAIAVIILLILNIKEGPAIIIAVLTGLPSGSLNVILAEQYDCNPQYAARTVVQTMVLMIVTLPLIISISLKLLQ